MKHTLPTGAYDVIVVGSGAGGAAATYRLIKAGMRVALIEKGERLPRDGTTLSVQKVIREGAFKSKEPWIDRAGRELVPEEYFNLGGKTKWYGAALAKFGAAEFAPDRDHDCLEWPCSYEEMRPYYEHIEVLLGVRVFAMEPSLKSITERLARRAPGWRTEPLPMGLTRGITEVPEEAAHFDGFASRAGFKSDAERSLLDRIADAPNLALMSGQTVTGLVGDTDEPERIIGVRLSDGRELRAKEIVLAAGAMHSPRLLEQYLRENGLDSLPIAESVGRNFKLHLLTAVLALSPSVKGDLIRKTTLLLNDRFPHSSIQPLGFDAELIATLVPTYVPRGVARYLGTRAYGFFLQTEDGSSRANRIVAGTSEEPRPMVDYDSRRTPAARREHRSLVRAFRFDLLKAGYVALAQPIGLHGTAHACGTLRAGNDSSDSVVDGSGCVHGMTGLRVADGSILARSSRVNPALTIYAWGLKVADSIAQGRPAEGGSFTRQTSNRTAAAG